MVQALLIWGAPNRDTSDVCGWRDVKVLYAKARKGEFNIFTGIDDPYEVLTNPEPCFCSPISPDRLAACRMKKMAADWRPYGAKATCSRIGR